jgi:hypothetical protein
MTLRQHYMFASIEEDHKKGVDTPPQLHDLPPPPGGRRVPVCS